MASWTGKKELKKRIKKEIAHRDFLNERNNTDNFTTTMSSAFREALVKK